MRIEDFTHAIEYAAHYVYQALGVGLEQAAYQKALVMTLQKRGLLIDETKTFPVNYQNVTITDFKPHLWINNTTVLQVMAKEKLKEVEEIHLTNHLTLQRIEMGYIVNFGLKIDIRTKFRLDRVIPVSN